MRYVYNKNIYFSKKLNAVLMFVIPTKYKLLFLCNNISLCFAFACIRESFYIEYLNQACYKEMGKQAFYFLGRSYYFSLCLQPFLYYVSLENILDKNV